MYKFSPGLGTPLKYNPCDGKVCTESTVKFPSSPTKVKSNSALTANENAEDSISVLTTAFNAVSYTHLTLPTIYSV